MTKQQEIDAKKCEEFQEQGIDMDCMECSCNCCIAQQITPRMFNNEELLLIKYALLSYQSDAYQWLLRTDERALTEHEKARLDVAEAEQLLLKVSGYLNE